MGKFKVSFTTVLFVFSFIVCVVVAVVFVDRKPKNDYDSFYDKSAAGNDGSQKDPNSNSGASDNHWNNGKSGTPAANASPAPASQHDAGLADLPIDPSLLTAPLPSEPSASPVATQNPMKGRSPDEIARALMKQSGINAELTAEQSMPSMALPPGMSGPAGQATPQAAATRPPSAPGYLPMQSNVQGASQGSMGPGAPGGRFDRSVGALPSVSKGLYSPPSLNNSTNTDNDWNPVQAQPTNSSMIGVRAAPSNPRDGMMISRRGAETGAAPPPGFSAEPVNDKPGSIPSPAPGGLDKPLLLPPQSQTGDNKWELPPAPTLRPPPIRDPDRQRSDATDDSIGAQTPDSPNPEGSSSQALAVSDKAGNNDGEPEKPAAYARVKDKTLSKDQAVKLAKVEFMMNNRTLTKDEQDDAAKKAAEEWTDITAAAEVAKYKGLAVNAPDLERYASMRPDFDPAAWQSSMAEAGFSESEIRAGLKDIALSENLVEHRFEKEFDEKQIKSTYEKRPSHFTNPRKVHLMELYKRKPDNEKRAKKVEREINRLQRQASEGTDFGLLARQTSDAPTRAKGGNLGWVIPSEDKDEERDKAVVDLKPGQVSKVLDEADGYRIYKLVDIKKATNDFEGGKDLVVADLKEDVRKDCFRDSLEILQSGAEIKPDVKTADADVSKDDHEKTASGDDSNGDAPDSEQQQRHKRAQELLAQAAKQRHDDERNQISAAAPGNIPNAKMPIAQQMRQSSAQQQLLYAPGTQVQQMEQAGGAPAPAYQPGGRTPAPVQNSMTTPQALSVNYRATPVQTADRTAYPQKQAAAQETPEGSVRSNGWIVQKTVRDASKPQDTPAPISRAPDPSVATEIPPGFEGSKQSGDSDANAQGGNGKKGIVGSVKNFFRGIGH